MTTTSTTDDSTVSGGAGFVFGAGATALGVLAPTRPLVGVVVYTVATVAAVALSSWAGTDLRPRPGSTAETTLALVGIAAAVGFPALVAANGLGYFAWTPLSTGVGFAVGGLFVVYGVVELADTVWGRAA